VNVVDSSAWLEYFADGPNAAVFAEPLGDVTRLVVPAITVYEVFKVSAASVARMRPAGGGAHAAGDGRRTVCLAGHGRCEDQP